jgi:hypothetical protein
LCYHWRCRVELLLDDFKGFRGYADIVVGIMLKAVHKIDIYPALAIPQACDLNRESTSTIEGPHRHLVSVLDTLFAQLL